MTGNLKKLIILRAILWLSRCCFLSKKSKNGNEEIHYVLKQNMLTVTKSKWLFISYFHFTPNGNNGLEVMIFQPEFPDYSLKKADWHQTLHLEFWTSYCNFGRKKDCKHFIISTTEWVRQSGVAAFTQKCTKTRPTMGTFYSFEKCTSVLFSFEKKLS